MNSVIIEKTITSEDFSNRAVTLSVNLWFVIATLGHWIFLIYILAAFYPPIAQHGLRGLEGMHLPSGFREGETLGNLASVSHILLAAIIIGGGPVQIIPAVRRRLPKFHHWLGRSYVLAALISSVGGLYMTWTRSPVDDVISQLGISGDAILIIIFSTLTVRYAIARQLEQHRRWALRLFMVAGAVWFYRVGLMAWASLTGGVGIDWEAFTGPFLYVLGFAQYLLPLILLEWYFYCQRYASSHCKIAFVLTLSILTVYMSIGIVAATIGMWLPRL